MTAQTDALNRQDENMPPADQKKSAASGFFRYILLPGFIPQIKELTQGGFGYLALMIACVYQGVRILPIGHAYTKHENIGSFGIREVIAEAANHVKLDRQNIDQILIFFAVLAGVVILALQLIAFVLLLLSGTAFANQTNPTPDSFGGIFNTPAEFQDTDIAFMMLRETFGIPDFFGPLGGDVSPIHQALQALFQFYNLAILVVAILVFIYYIIVVVAETAQTGTPFGQRFSQVYAPFRLVIAIGLLVPLNYGLNGSQYIALYAAKLGSGFATTGWTEFNKSITEKNPLGAKGATLISDTKAPDVGGLVEFMGDVVGCKKAYESKEKITIEGKVAFTKPDNSIEHITFDTNAYSALSSANNKRDILVVFGANRGKEGSNEEFKPLCGTAIVPITVPMADTGLDSNGEIEAKPEPKSGDMGYLQKAYFNILYALWTNTELERIGGLYAEMHNSQATADLTEDPKAEDREKIISSIKSSVEDQVKKHFEDAQANANIQIRQQTLERGWGGAGIWYNRVAQINGGYVVTTMSPPNGKKYPDIMEQIRAHKKKQDGKVEPCKSFEPNFADNAPFDYKNAGVDRYYANVLDEVHQYWTCNKSSKLSGNFFLDAASAIFGLNGLITIRELDDEGNPKKVQVHPLAKLSALGRGLVESAIRNMALAIATSTIGGLESILGPHFGPALGAASSMLTSIATIALSIGFITYYILPFLPFIYFLFAVGSWVKGIFEAMVGAPLWALAHLRIDGDGLPGKMALNGYVLILEIFLRPILTVFGLLGGMATFSAMAYILNEVFNLVVVNTANVDLNKKDARGIIDVFFFTIMYAVILYIMALASFKMINLVPNGILRWLGSSASPFSDNSGDPTDGLIQYAAIGGAQIGGQIGSGLTQLGRAGGQTVDAFFKVSQGSSGSGGPQR